MEICHSFHQYCLSPEESNNICIPYIIQLGKTIKAKLKNYCIDSCIAVQYGKRLIITKKDVTVDFIQRTDINEIIDVDPVKNTIMFFGPSTLHTLSPLLFMICYAKEDIHYIIALRMKEKALKEDMFIALPHVEKEKTFLDLLKSLLMQLQSCDKIIVDESILILTAKTKEQMEKIIENVSDYENSGSR